MLFRSRLIRSLVSSDRNWKTEFIFISGFWAGHPVDVGRDTFAPYTGDLGNLRPEGMSLPSGGLVPNRPTKPSHMRLQFVDVSMNLGKHHTSYFFVGLILTFIYTVFCRDGNYEGKQGEGNCGGGKSS